MNTAAVIAFAVVIFIYVELAIFAGAYMYLKTTQNTADDRITDKSYTECLISRILFKKFIHLTPVCVIIKQKGSEANEYNSSSNHGDYMHDISDHHSDR